MIQRNELTPLIIPFPLFKQEEVEPLGFFRKKIYLLFFQKNAALFGAKQCMLSTTFQ